MSAKKGRHNIKRNDTFQRKSVFQLKEIAERGSLGSACAMYWLRAKGSKGNTTHDDT